MNLHARIELFGGPEDGREFVLPTGTDGSPVTPLPISSAPDENQDPNVAMYDRSHQRPCGQWIYRYAVNLPVSHPA
ncbi:hypothetical protein [Parasphingorhabdus pacifica]